MNAYNTLLSPVLSEKKQSVCVKHNRNMFFYVMLKASKKEIQEAVESMFKVNVESVRTSILRGKYRRRGMHVSFDFKKEEGICNTESWTATSDV